MGVEATLPLVSLIISPDMLWDEETGLYTHPQGTGQAWERPLHITYLNQDRQTGFQVPAGVRIHGGFSRTFDKKSLRLYFRESYGLDQLKYPLFDRREPTTFKRLVLHSGAQDSSRKDLNWALLRNQIVARLATQVNGKVGRSQPAWVFINGQSWGIYQIRERLDQWFLADHYGIVAADLLDTPGIAESEKAKTGDFVHWEQLIHYINEHSLTEPEAYAYVTTQVDLDNLIDYFIIQIYTDNYDWLSRNLDQFRASTPGGRWQWFFWDNDWSLGLNPYSSITNNTVARVLAPHEERHGEVSTLLLRKLLENHDFRLRFLQRAEELLNTLLAPYNVITQINNAAAELAPDIQQEAERWPSVVAWENSIQDLRNFAQKRPVVVRQHFVEAFELGEAVPLTYQEPVEGQGHIAVNGTLLPFLPWQGYYFGGIPIEITPVPAPGYRFVGWEESTLGQEPSLSLTVVSTQTLTPRFEPADPATWQPRDVTIVAVHLEDDGGGMAGNWIELRVNRRGGVDLRGWRLTDNDTKTATDEGSLIFAAVPALAHVPRYTTVCVVAPGITANDAHFAKDDLNAWDHRLVLYVGNDALDATTDPWFEPVPGDALVLLAPGLTAAFDDDQGIDFVSNGSRVTPASFGVLVDGVGGQ
ncbi:MAG: CotH kinase family protein [Chloroflexota bacterium]|nr:CotH kinase family protein [Chloroflexota bacterium]